MIARYRKRFLHLLVVLPVMLMMVVTASSGVAFAECSVEFGWLPNPESFVTGYNIYYGTSQGGPYSFVVDAGNPAPVDGLINGTVSGLTEGNTYYFVATAYDADGNESAPCAEVSYTCPGGSSPPPPGDTTPPSPPSGLGVHL